MRGIYVGTWAEGGNTWDRGRDIDAGDLVWAGTLALGADIVVYSATKHIDGQGRVLGGAILGATELMTEAYKDILRHTGPALSPFNSWVLLKGLETLELRVRRQTENAAKVTDAVVKAWRRVTGSLRENSGASVTRQRPSRSAVVATRCAVAEP